MPNNITPPRVPLTDPRTGRITTEWFRFLLSVFNLTGSDGNSISLTDLQQAPPVIPYVAPAAVDPIPSGMIAFFLVSTPPDGWEEVTELRGKFPRGMADPSTDTPGATGGSATDTATTGTDSGVYNIGFTAGGTTKSLAVDGHTHSVTVDTVPPYVDGMWCRKL